MRNDPAVQTALDRDTAAASSPTLCRFENRADRAPAWSTQRILVEQFIASLTKAPTELISLAYVLMERLRAIGLVGTELARTQVGTIRARLLKVGAVIVRNTRRVRFFLASAFPHQAIFRLVAERFASG